MFSRSEYLWSAVETCRKRRIMFIFIHITRVFAMLGRRSENFANSQVVQNAFEIVNPPSTVVCLYGGGEYLNTPLEVFGIAVRTTFPHLSENFGIQVTPGQVTRPCHQFRSRDPT